MYLHALITQPSTQRAATHRWVLLSAANFATSPWIGTKIHKRSAYHRTYIPESRGAELQWIGAEVDHLRPSGRLPISRVDTTLGNREIHLPIVVTDRVEVAALIEIENLMARAIVGFALEVGHKILAIEMLLEGLVADRIARGHLLHDVRVARRSSKAVSSRK